MAQVGCLGDIAFFVSSSAIKTFDKLQWSGSAQYGEHQRHLASTLPEFVGMNAEKVTLEILLSAYLGVNPMREIDKLISYERRGKTLPLVIGEKTIGRYRWTIKSHTVKMQTFGLGGVLTSATVSLELQEYPKS